MLVAAVNNCTSSVMAGGDEEDEIQMVPSDCMAGPVPALVLKGRLAGAAVKHIDHTHGRRAGSICAK
eukprot:4378427-Pyramimonas_sp.AAC.1